MKTTNEKVATVTVVEAKETKLKLTKMKKEKLKIVIDERTRMYLDKIKTHLKSSDVLLDIDFNDADIVIFALSNFIRTKINK